MRIDPKQVGPLQVLLAKVTADRTVTTAAGLQVLLDQPITTRYPLSTLLVDFSASAEVTGLLGTNSFQLSIDGGALVAGMGIGFVALSTPASGNFTWLFPGLAPGAHNVTVKWQVTGLLSVLTVRATTDPTHQSASLRVVEIPG